MMLGDIETDNSINSVMTNWFHPVSMLARYGFGNIRPFVFGSPSFADWRIWLAWETRSKYMNQLFDTLAVSQDGIEMPKI